MTKFTPKHKRRVKIPTPLSLSNVAAHYMTRYAASESSLRRVLQNRLRRSAMHHPDFANDDEKQNQLRAAIEDIITRYKKSGILNDKAYAEMKTRSLRRAGRSSRVIQQKLGQKGVKADIIQDALLQNEDDLDAEETEFKAALILAKRRRLGPFRKNGETDLDLHRKDLASLARAGFSLAIARKALKPSEE